MSHMLEIIKKQNELTALKTRQEIRACNDISQRFGLVLNDKEIEALMKNREEALKRSGRVEFGESILPRLIYAFCDSPYIEQDQYEETLSELQEAFYYFKSEALDCYTDDEVIGFMVAIFNGAAQGSIEYLTGTSIDLLCRYARTGWNQDLDEAGELF